MSKDLGNSLTEEMRRLLDSERVNAVLATLTDGSAWPHTTPLYLIKTKNAQQIFFALASGHQASANLVSNGKAMLSVMAENDQAFSIQLRVSEFRHAMEGNGAMSAFLGDVLAIKSDTTPTVTVEAGVKTQYRSGKTEAFFRMMFDELAREAAK